MRKYNNRSAEQDAIDAQWKQLTSREFSEEELEEYDKKLEPFNFLRTRADLERYYVSVGAAHWGYGPNKNILIFLRDKKNPTRLCQERVDNKIEQWQKWRTKKFPPQRLRDYNRMAQESMSSHVLVHHDDKGDIDPLAEVFEALP